MSIELHSRFISLRGLCASALVLLVAGCAGFSVTGGPGRTVNPSVVSNSGSVTAVESNRALRELSSLVLLPAEFDGQAQPGLAIQESIDEAIYAAFVEDLGLEVQRVADVLPEFRRESSTSLARPFKVPSDLALLRGKDVDGVLRVRVLEYFDRKGSAVGAQEPARVSFVVGLHRLADAEELWSASYRFYDRALTDNLFEVERRLGKAEPGASGLGFRSAQELLESGARQVARQFSHERVGGFLR